MTDPAKLVERLLSGKPTPLEREAGEALASLADELRLARELLRDVLDANPRYNATAELAARIDFARAAMKEPRS